MVKQKHLTITTEGIFDDIYPPKFQLFNVILKQVEYQIKEIKTDEIISSEKTFSIKINANKIPNSFIDSLSSELKAAFSLRFAPFDKSDKSYNFYITRYTGDMDARKKILIGILDTLQDFEIDCIEKLEQNKPIFEKAKEEVEDFQTDEFDVRFSKSLNTFIVVAKSLIGLESFKKLASCSKELGKIADNEFVNVLFENNKKYSKKTYFIINQSDYIVINDYIRGLKKNNESFIDTQEKFFLKSESRFKALEFDKPNVFDYKIKINEERKCFEFFCKGFKLSNPWEGIYPQSSLLQIWAINLILSSPISVMKEGEYKIQRDIKLPDIGQEDLVYQKDSSKKDKVYFVPFTEIEKLERIHKNYLKEDEFWARQQYTVKHPCFNFRKNVLNADLSQCPAVYLDSDGQAYLVFESRGSTSKKLNVSTISFKGIKITPNEFKDFITSHPFAEEIHNNTKVLNAQLWAGPTSVFNYESLEAAYADIIMAYRINNGVTGLKTSKKLKI